MTTLNHIDRMGSTPGRTGMELTHAAVVDRIADLHALAAELRVARALGAAAAMASPHAAQPPRSGTRLGDLLIGLGTALGGNPSATRNQPSR